MEELLELKPEYLLNPMMRYYGLRRNCNIVTCILRSMLLCKFPASKSFHVEAVLNLICRILSVTCITLRNACLTNDTIALSGSIGIMHGYAFDLLQAVIICGKRNLIPFSTLICKLCIQSLKWTSSIAHSHGVTESFGMVRKRAYGTLKVWLTVAGSCSAIEIFVDELIPHIISDIECDKRAVMLLIDHPKGKTKRKRGERATEMSTTSETTTLIKRKLVCRLAHENLQLIFCNSSIFLKWEHHKNLQILVINELLDMMKYNVQYKYPFPYSDWKCRMMLYKSLCTLFTEPHPKWLTPTSHIIGIFNTGINDSQMQISRFCREVFSSIEAINHPKAPAFSFEKEDVLRILSSDKVVRLSTNLQNHDFVEAEKLDDSRSGVEDVRNVSKNSVTDYNSRPAIAPYSPNCKPSEDAPMNMRAEGASSFENFQPTAHQIFSTNEISRNELKLSSKITSNELPTSEKLKNTICTSVNSVTVSVNNSDVCSMLNDFVDVIV